jgi:RNA polymerase sigma-70 factor, ECF subfamily
MSAFDAADFSLNFKELRPYLLMLAKKQWNSVLEGWCEPSDIVNETLLEAYAKRGDFRGKTKAALACWVRAILAHNLADLIRKRTAKKRDCRLECSIDATVEESSQALGRSLADTEGTPSEIAEATEDIVRLGLCLEILPVDYQTAIRLHHLEGKSVAETAREMNKSKQAISGLLRRGLVQLGKLLGDE